jgi:hypothetical protein
MALAANSRGAGSTNTGGQSTLAITPASNSAAWPGSMMFLTTATDNAGASGTNPFTGGSITDSLGNIWTVIDSQTNSAGGVANDGVTLMTFYCYPKRGLTTADTITITYTVTTVARAWTLTEVTCAAGKYVLNIGNGGNATGNSTAPSASNPGANVIGDIVMGCAGGQDNNAITADSDVTGGSWSTQQTSGVGVGAAGMEIASQNKVVTATTAQTYNLTITSALWVCFIRTFRETNLPAYLTRHDTPPIHTTINHAAVL